LSAVRDFTDVKDMVIAYELALEQGKSGEVYNLGSGRRVSIQKLVAMLLSKSRVKITIVVDKSRLRPIDVKSLVCDSSKFRNLTGWKTRVPLEKTLERVLDYWREQI